MTKIEEFVLGVQKRVCKVKRDVENEFHKSKYADLEGVLDVLNPYFVEHSVLVDQSPIFKDGEWLLRTRISLGDESTDWFFPLLGLESKTPMQSLGSAVTYARRYQLKGIFKLVDSDDDGNAVTPSGEPEKPARKSDVDKMLRAFASLTVTKDEVEQRYQLDVEQFTAHEMADLKKVFGLIKSGKKKEEFFSGEKTWQD